VNLSAGRLTIRDKKGGTYELGLGGSGDFASLLKMYDVFLPKKAAQGLPPEERPAREQWVHCLMDKGDNLLVWRDAEVVGHGALLPDFTRKDAEYMIFVNQAFRGQGLGTALTRSAMLRARELCLNAVWLTVDGHNYRAIGLYKKFGFVFCDDGGWERFMLLRL